MKITVALMLAVMLSLTATATAAAPVHLTMREADLAAQAEMALMLAAFTETPPLVQATCRRLASNAARCQVAADGDRVHVRLMLRVRETQSDYKVLAWGMRTLPVVHPARGLR